MFHGNLEEVRDAIASLGNNLHAIQLSANVDATGIPVEFLNCSQRFNDIIRAFTQEVVGFTGDTARFAYNNLLSNVASGRNRDQILLSLNRFFENGQAARREAIRSRAREIQDDINILWHSVQDNEGILNRRKFNTPAILNRFQTVFNGIEWFDNAFYPTIAEYVQHWKVLVSDGRVTNDELKESVRWLTLVMNHIDALRQLDA